MCRFVLPNPHLVVVDVARIFNIYGQGMRLDDGRLVGKFISRALQIRALTVCGDGLMRDSSHA